MNISTRPTVYKQTVFIIGIVTIIENKLLLFDNPIWKYKEILLLNRNTYLKSYNCI